MSRPSLPVDNNHAESSFLPEEQKGGTASLALIQRITCGLLALIAAFVSCIVVDAGGDPPFFSNSVFSLPLIAVYYLTIRQAFRTSLDRRYKITSMALALVFSFSIIIGSNIETFETTRICSAATAIEIVGLLPISYSLFLLLLTFLNEKHPIICIAPSKEATEGKSRETLFSFLILAGWLPVFMAFYPGIYGYDSIYQTAQMLGGEGLSSHHPVIHTALINACLGFGINVLGQAEPGMAMYSVIQMLIMSFAFGSLTQVVWQRSSSKPLTALTICWFALCPLNSLFAISCTKDVLFTGFLCLALSSWLKLADATSTKHECKKRRRGYLSFALFATIALLLRNNALIAYLPSVAIIIATTSFSKKNSGHCGLKGALVAPILLCLVVTGPVYSLAGVSKDTTIRESLSVPLQQMARTMVYHAEDLDNDERNYVNALIPGWQNYQPGISDQVKGSLNTELLANDPNCFCHMYVKIGLEHPITYTDSFLLNTVGYWYPGVSGGELGGWSYHPYLETENTSSSHGNRYIYIERNSMIPALEKLLTSITIEKIWERIPGISLTMNSGVLIWVYLTTAAAFLLSRNRDGSPAAFFLFSLFYWSTLVLGPCLLVRYLYPLFSFLPLLLPCRTTSDPDIALQ